MHLTLTDHLTCPRCGPATGLILLMEHAEERRVREGALGCPVCRTQYAIDGGVADLRAGVESAGSQSAGAQSAFSQSAFAQGALAQGGAGEWGMSVAAWLGLGEGRGFVLLDGPAAPAVATRVAELVPDYEVVVARGGAGAEVGGTSTLLDSGPLPIRDAGMRAVAWLGGAPPPERLAELLRVCRPTGRLMVDAGDPAAGSMLDGVAAQLEAGGASVRAREGGALLAVAG